MRRIRTPLATPARFSLFETVMSHGWREVRPFEWDGARLSRRDPEGEASVQQVDGTTVVEHDREDLGAADRFATILNLELDLEPFWALCGGHPTLAWAAARGAGRILRGRDAWEDASKAVCFTNIAWPQAVRCIDRVAEACPDGWWPIPAQILGQGEAWLRERCRIGYRAPYLVKMAEGFEEGRFSRASRSRKQFQAMPGIGPATARYLAGMWGSWDELWYDSSVAWLLRERDGLARPTARDAEERYAPFGRWRGLACLVDLHGFHRGAG